MDRCDVLIVGGGPAGSSLAWALRGSGLDVIVMDKKKFPRDKVCAGWVTPAVIDVLQLDTDDYRQGRVFQPIHGFRISCMGGKQVETFYSGQPVSYGIRRCEFDHYLLERSGATLRLGEPFKGMVRDGDTWIVNEQIETPLVVGAGGHFCPVARAIGAKLGRSEMVVAAQEIEFKLRPEESAACNVKPEVPELFFCEDLGGYGWVFRKQDYLNVGLGREDNHKLSEHVKEFCAFLQERDKLPHDVNHKFNGHAYLLYQHAVRQEFVDGAFLVGDAAGLAYPQSGEGIRPAVESGMMAADVIRAAQGDYRRAQLAGYLARLRQRFGEREADPSISAKLPDWLKRSLAQKLLATHWFTRHVVMDRWFLHLGEPPLYTD